MIGEENDLLQISPAAWNLISKQWSQGSSLTWVVSVQDRDSRPEPERRNGSVDLVSYYYGNPETFVAAKG